MASAIEVRRATPADWRDALNLALAPLAPSARAPLVDSIATAGPHPLGPLDALVVAVADGVVSAACWAQPSPGRVAVFWPPEHTLPSPAETREVDAQLIAEAVGACDAAGVSLAQLLTADEDDPRLASAAACGFSRLARLAYVELTLPGGSPGTNSVANARSNAGEPLRFEPIDPDDPRRLKAVLEATYVGSLDCPGIESVRSLDDVLVGYRAVGRYDPQTWQIAVDDGVDAGVVLVSEHEGGEQAELVYLGVAHSARGRGHGARLIAHAVALAEELGADRLVAAVDTRNTPAWRLYDEAGFAPWAHRTVYVRKPGGAALDVVEDPVSPTA